MDGSLRRLFHRAAMALLCGLLAALFVTLQFFASDQTPSRLLSLAPAETSSPRSTLLGFRSDAARAATLLMDAYRQNQSEPGLFWSEGVADKVAEADALLARASRSFDLSDVAPVELSHRRLEVTLLMKEILDRIPLPDPASIPGDAEVAAQPIAGWNVPNTEIRIRRIGDGPRAGEYLFSSETVDQLGDFYNLIRNRPNLAGATEDFYDFFGQSPGKLLPPKWYGLVEAMPSGLRIQIQGQAVWQWIGLAVVIGLAALAAIRVRRRVRSAVAGGDPLVALLGSVAVPGAVAVAALFVRYMTDEQINLTGRVGGAVEEATQGIAYLAMIWGILKTSNTAAGQLTLSRAESIDAHLAKAAVRVAGIGMAVVLLFYGASYLGIPLAGLLAGLGLGGLAVALAAKPTIENFIGGLILYADRPVRVGDLCKFGALKGRVEEIGLRSTRIRGLDRTLITVPNATFVDMNIINLTNRDRMPYERTIALHARDSASICQEIEDYTAVVAAHPRTEPGSVMARLREGQEERPRVEISALILTSRWDEFLRIQQEIDLLLRDRILALRPSASADADNIVSLKEATEHEKAHSAGV